MNEDQRFKIRVFWGGYVTQDHRQLISPVQQSVYDFLFIEMLRRNGPVVKSVESVLRLEGGLWRERFVKEVGYRPNVGSPDVVIVHGN